MWPGTDPGVRNTRHSPPPSPVLTSDLPPKIHKIDGDLATIWMISDNRTIIFCFGIVIIHHHNMPKVGVVTRLHMHYVHNLAKFPPPLITLYPPLSDSLVPSPYAHKKRGAGHETSNVRLHTEGTQSPGAIPSVLAAYFCIALQSSVYIN